MSKIFKVASALLGVIAFIMMFIPQVIVNWSVGSETLGFNALVGGTYGPSELKTDFNGVGSGLAGYILVGVAALLIIATAFLTFFKEHEVLNYIALGAAIICLIIGIILIFLIRMNFSNSNGGIDTSMGAGMIIAGIAAIISVLTAGIALVLDIAQ